MRSLLRPLTRPLVKSAPIVLKNIPLTANGYTALGFPAPDYIWDLGVSDLPFPELVVGGGTNDLVDQAAHSVDWAHAVSAPGLPVSQLIAERQSGTGTARAAHSSNAFLDITTSERVAIGHLWRLGSTPAGASRLFGKRTSRGWYGGIDNNLYPTVLTDAVEGNVSATLATAHPINAWHYGCFVVDRDPELARVTTELGEATADISTQSSLTIASAFGFNANDTADHYTGALCAWTGSKVASLTQSLCQAFLNKVGA